MHEYTIHHVPFFTPFSISVVTEKTPNDDGVIVLTDEEFDEMAKSGVPGDRRDWDFVTGNGLVVVYPRWEMEFDDKRIAKYVSARGGK